MVVPPASKAVGIVSLVAVSCIVLTILERLSKNRIGEKERGYQIESMLLSRGFDTLASFDYGNLTGARIEVRQRYWRDLAKFRITRGLYIVHANNESVARDIINMQIPSVLIDASLDPLFFIPDQNHVESTADKVTIAAPFLLSSIPLHALTRPTGNSYRILTIGSGIVSVSRFFQERARGGTIIVDAIETLHRAVATGEFPTKCTQYDSIHLDDCDERTSELQCPSSDLTSSKSVEKLANILSSRGTLTVTVDSESNIDDLRNTMLNHFSKHFKRCFFIGYDRVDKLLICSKHSEFHQNRSDLMRRAVEFGQITGFDIVKTLKLR